MTFVSKTVTPQRKVEALNVSVDEKLDCIRDAYRVSRKKVKYTANTWKKRTDMQILSDHWVGDFAKQTVKLYLQSQNLSVIDYDDVRDDGFKRPDMFDLTYNGIEIEIKSSVEKYTTNLIDIINKRRIIDNKYSSHVNHSNIIVQVFFIPKKAIIGKKFEMEVGSLPFNDDSIRKIATILQNQFDVYIMGWTTRMALQQHKEIFKVSNRQLSANIRSYTDFTLDTCYNMNTLCSHLSLMSASKNIILP